MYILLLLIILLFISIIFRKLNILTIQNLFLLYLCIITTIILFCLCIYNTSELFYLFNFEYLYSLLKLPVTEKIKNVTEIPANSELKDLIVILTKSVNSLNSNVELLLQEQKMVNAALYTSLKQGQLLGNSQIEKLNNIVENTSNLKSSISALQSSLDLGFKNTIVSLKDQTKAYNEQTKEVLLNLVSLNEIYPKILHTLNISRDLQINSVFTQKEILSTLSAQSDLINEVGSSTLNALDAKASNIADLNQKYEMLKQVQESDHLQNIENTKKLQAELRKNQVETSVIKSDVNAFKSKEIETKATWYNNIPYISDYFTISSNKK